jgi:hypothetical protein
MANIQMRKAKSDTSVNLKLSYYYCNRIQHSPSSSSSHSPIKFFLRSSIFFSCSLAISSFFFLEIRGFFSWVFVVEAVEVSGLATLGVLGAALGVFLALPLDAFGVAFFSAGALGVFGVFGVLGVLGAYNKYIVFQRKSF